LATQLRGGARLGATGRPIRYAINLGIGGSHLGPRLVCDVLAGPRAGRGDGIDVAFVSNVDPEHLSRALAGADPATTLFVVVSKSFTTQETLKNATSAREWLAAQLGGGPALGAHFIAVTANAAAARAFGVAGTDVLPMWDWVGGRFSLWSAAGLAIAIRCGWESFAELPDGTRALGRAGHRQPTRALPMVASGNACRSGRVHRACARGASAIRSAGVARRQRTRAGTGFDDGQAARRGAGPACCQRRGAGCDRQRRTAPRLPGRPPVDDAAVAGAERAPARPAACALRAPHLRRRRALRDQFVRPMGRGARQGAGGATDRRCARRRR